MPDLFFILTSILIVSYELTYLIRIVSLRRNIVDMPNSRSSHSIPTPRGGGLAIVLTWYLGLIFIYLKGYIADNLFLALLPGILLAIVSFVDDIVRLKPGIRLVVQLTTAALSIFFLGGIESLVLFDTVAIPKIIFIPIMFIAIVWFINLFNFLDGIDGYASIEAVCVLSGMYLFTGSFLSLILIAAVSGFLIWNWPKAKIFMGDVGSTQLGFILIVLGIYYHNENQFSIVWWIILTLPFWFDATYTLFRRWRNGEKLHEAHRKHIYQRLVQSGFSHLTVDAGLLTLNIILTALVYISFDFEKLQILIFIISVGLLFLLVRYTEKRKPFPLDK